MDVNQELSLTLTAGDCSVMLQLLNEAPYRVAAPLIEKIRTQILALDPTAVNVSTAPVPNGQAIPP